MNDRLATTTANAGTAQFSGGKAPGEKPGNLTPEQEHAEQNPSTQDSPAQVGENLEQGAPRKFADAPLSDKHQIVLEKWREIANDSVVSAVEKHLQEYDNARAGDGSTGARENPKVLDLLAKAIICEGDRKRVSMTFSIPESEFVEGQRTVTTSFDL